MMMLQRARVPVEDVQSVARVFEKAVRNPWVVCQRAHKSSTLYIFLNSSWTASYVVANGGKDKHAPGIEVQVQVGFEQLEQRIDDLRHTKGMSKVVIGIGW